MIARPRRFLYFALLAIVSGCTTGREVGQAPPGDPKSAKTRVLESGAQMLQTDTPPDALDVYMVGFHAAKHDPSHQMEAHHFCRQVNQDFAQCALYDGNTKSANLVGIEYIISAKLFETLPQTERTYWHPHNYEILSGTLIAPGLPAAAEKAFLRDKLNSYGKTWHVWNSAPFGMRGDALPLGEPILEWSFNRDGEALPGLVQERDQRMRLNSEAKRRERAELTPAAQPQQGVDALNGKFSRATRPLPGVTERDNPTR